MKKNRKFQYLLALTTIAVFSFGLASCGGDDEESGGSTSTKVSPLPQMSNVSLSYHASVETVTLARDVNNIQLSGKILSFDVEENNVTSSGHRFDTLVVAVNGTRIGTICVTQARNPFSDTRLVWANENALYLNKQLTTTDLSGLEMTKLIYNLEKSTGGKDSYKNYPAFAVSHQ